MGTQNTLPYFIFHKNAYVIRAFIIALLLSSQSVLARTLVEVEIKTNKGCKYIYYHNLSNPSSQKLVEAKWDGVCRLGYIDGDGVLRTTDGEGTIEIYKGSLSEGKWQGNISIESIKLDGTKGISHVVFEGGLANGYGEATIIPPNDKRITYQGQFKDGQFNGAGKLITPRGTYSGEFQDGKLTGDARYVSPDESIKYTGPLHNYKPHGIGKLASTKGSISGEFVNGKPMGAVIFEPANSIWAYKGELRNGMPDGLGTYTFKNGNKLTINTVSGVPDSTGIINYTNGDVYEGEIVSMLPEGRGRISNRLNNTWYEGEFRNGVPDGNGVYSDSTGLYEVNYTKGKQTTRIKLAGASGISNDVGTEQKSEDIMDRLDRVLEYFAKQRATQDAAVAQSKQSRDNRPTISCLLKHEWTSGLNKNCVYDCVGSEAVNTIGAANICPLLWERDFWR